MKILALFLLVGLSFASPLRDEVDDVSDKFDLSFLEEIQHASSLNDYLAEESVEVSEKRENEIKTKLGKTLKEGLEHVLVKIKEAVDEGKVVKGEFLDKVKELREKLHEIKVQTGNRSKELMHEIKEKVKDYFKKVLEKFGFDKRSVEQAEFAEEEENEINTELGKTLKEGLERVLKKIKEAVDEGKVVKDEFLDKVKELREKLHEINVNTGNRTKELMHEIKEKAKDYFKKVLEKFGLDKRSVEEAEFAEERENKIKTELGKTLKEGLERVLEKIKEAVDEGKIVKSEFLDKVKDLLEKLHEINVKTGNRTKDLMREIKEKANDFFKKVLEKVGLDKQSVEFAEEEKIEIKTELGKTLKEGLERVLEKIKEAVDEGKVVKNEFLDKVKELQEKLHEMNVKTENKTKELMRDIKEKVKDYLKKVLEKFGLDKRAVEYNAEEMLSELNYRDVLQKIKEHLKNNIDPELLKEKLEKLVDQGTELIRKLLKTLKEKGKNRLEMLIDTLLGDQEEDQRTSRGIREYWEKVKDYFKDLKIDLQEKYMKFGEWVKNVLDKGMEHSKDKMDNIRAIAKEFLRHAKNVSKEVGAEASEFFRQYKDDLGNIWEELKESFQQIRNKN